MELPLRLQGTLLTGIRGCDLAFKPFNNMTGEYGDSPERRLVAFLRYCTLTPADQREIDVVGAWFQSTPPEKWKPSQLTHYPAHWLLHLMHCFEVVGYCHPDCAVAPKAYSIYSKLVHHLHLNVETRDQMMARLTEDRIASGEVVS